MLTSVPGTRFAGVLDAFQSVRGDRLDARVLTDRAGLENLLDDPAGHVRGDEVTAVRRRADRERLELGVGKGAIAVNNDQDALNHAFDGDYKILGPEWNCIANLRYAVFNSCSEAFRLTPRTS